MPRITCPGCKNSYNVPEAALGRRVHCKRCDERFLVAIPEEEELYSLASEPEPPPDARPAAAASSALAMPSVDPTRASFRETAPLPQGFPGLLRDTGWAFLPFTDVGAVVTFIFLAIAMVLYVAVGYFIAIAQLIITGWYFAYLLNVIESAAAGERELPSLQPEGGFGALFLPLIKFMAVALVSQLPFFVTLLHLNMAGLLPWDELTLMVEALLANDYPAAFGGLSVNAALVIAAALGTLLFATLIQPMLFLCVAVGGLGELLRVDLMLQTILRTPASYGLVLAVFVLMSWLPSVVSLFVPESEPGKWSGVELVYEVGVSWLTVYCDLVAFRVVGYYYHHCKDRFAWSWG